MVIVYFIDILPEAMLILGHGHWRQSYPSDGEDPTMLSLRKPGMEKIERKKSVI